jgi:hypothetical protein
MLGTLGLVHAPVYRAAEVRDALGGLGLTERAAGYLAERAAPLGPVGPEVVTACFYGFAPRLVAAHVPAVWDTAAPAQVLSAALDAIRAVLVRVLPDQRSEVASAATLLRDIAEGIETAGRTLAAAWSAVPWTGDDHIDLWLATTRIRESRGDGHVALLVAEGIGPLASHLLVSGDGAERRAELALLRGWSDDECASTADALRDRGLLAADGKRTDAARAVREHLELRTDQRSAEAWRAAGPARVAETIRLASAFCAPMLASGTLMPPVLARVRALL